MGCTSTTIVRMDVQYVSVSVSSVTSCLQTRTLSNIEPFLDLSRRRIFSAAIDHDDGWSRASSHTTQALPSTSLGTHLLISVLRVHLSELKREHGFPLLLPIGGNTTNDSVGGDSNRGLSSGARSSSYQQVNYFSMRKSSSKSISCAFLGVSRTARPSSRTGNAPKRRRRLPRTLSQATIVASKVQLPTVGP